MKEITFGKYYLNNSEAKEALTWLVLEEKDGKALIITKQIIDFKVYDCNAKACYYKSWLRHWINTKFQDAVFTEEEKEKILETIIDNSLDSTEEKENKNVCLNCKDKLFLLSLKELNKYFNIERQAKGSIFANQNGLSKYSINGYGQWWLRSPSPEGQTTKYVDEYGNVKNKDVCFKRDECGNVLDGGAGVRVACWIKL